MKIDVKVVIKNEGEVVKVVDQTLRGIDLDLSHHLIGLTRYVHRFDDEWGTPEDLNDVYEAVSRWGEGEVRLTNSLHTLQFVQSETVRMYSVIYYFQGEAPFRCDIEAINECTALALATAHCPSEVLALLRETDSRLNGVRVIAETDDPDEDMGSAQLPVKGVAVEPAEGVEVEWINNWAVTITFDSGEGIQSVVSASNRELAIVAATRRLTMDKNLGIIPIKGVEVHAMSDNEPEVRIVKKIENHGFTAAWLDDGRVSMYDDLTGAYITTFAPAAVVKEQFKGSPHKNTEEKMTIILYQASQLSDMQDYV